METGFLIKQKEDTFFDQFEKINIPNLGLVRLPHVDIDEESKKKIGLSKETTNTNYLKNICWQGYLQKKSEGKFTNISSEEVKKRLQTEFAVFEKTGIVDYLLLVWDILRWCDEQKVPRGRGRGSAAGSLSLYCLNITDVNPLRHNLNFTRFLSEARAKPVIIDGILYVDGKSLCDIDSDVSFARRQDVINYIEQRYRGKTCKISNRLQLTGKTALKDVLKCYLEYDETAAKNITDNIVSVFGVVESLDKAFERSEPLKKWLAESDHNKLALEIAKSLEGINVAKGQHASGIFIAHNELDGNIPIELSKTKEAVTSFDMDVAAQMGVKIDILGLRTLDVLYDACSQVNIDPNKIDIDDQSIYDYFKTRDAYYGLFQIEEGLTKNVVTKIRPRNIDDLSACLAISRPGSLRYIDDYAAFVHEGKVTTLYPAIDKILKDTGGIILYQEQINEICQSVYHLSAVDADEVRRAIGKKDPEGMAKWEPVLFKQGEKLGIPDEVTKQFWSTCYASANYLFNSSHSWSYAYLTASTAYVKTKYPKEFYLALLKMSKHEASSHEVIKNIVVEAKSFGVEILPPDLIKSDVDFKFEDSNIRFGLAHIKGVSGKTMEKLLSFRREYSTKFQIFEAAKECGLSINVLAGLIYSGCLQYDNYSRSKLVLEAQTYNLLTDREKILVHKLSDEYREELLKIIIALTERKDDKGKPYIKASRFSTIKKKYDPYKQMYLENSRNEDLCSYMMESFFLGYSYSQTLRDIYKKRVEGLSSLGECLALPSDSEVKFVANVGEAKSHVSKEKKTPYYKMEVYDETEKASVMIYGEKKLEACENFYGKLPEEGDIVICEGVLADGGMIFSQRITIQKNPIKFKKSELEQDPE